MLLAGANGGLGREMARELVARGARVMLVARGEATLGALKAELGEGTEIFATDLTQEGAAQAAVNAALQRFGGLDALVFAAGRIQVGPAEAMTAADWRSAAALNHEAALALCLAAEGPLKARRGRVLLVSSIGGVTVMPHLAPYSASKWALSGLGLALAAEWRASGVSVTTAFPGLMNTGGEANAEFRGDVEAERLWFETLARHPLLSMPPRKAAARMIGDMAAGKAFSDPSGIARLAGGATHLFPNETLQALGLLARALPKPPQ